MQDFNDLPDLTHIYCIALTKVQQVRYMHFTSNIQCIIITYFSHRILFSFYHLQCLSILLFQIVLSYQDLYLRIEESFVGPQGTFALLTGSAHKTEEFVNVLRQTIERADSCEQNTDDTHITYNGETLLNLKAALNSVEKLPNIEDIQVILYMLVHLSVEGNYSTHSFVLTNSHIYILREDYILWPKPTFGKGPAVRAKFEVVLAIPAAAKINAVQLYDTDAVMQRDTLAENMNVTGLGATLTSKDFVGFGVRISFTVPDVDDNMTTVASSNKSLDIRVPTSGMREKFLVSLTQVRRVHGVSTSMSRGNRSRRKKKDLAQGKLLVNHSTSTSNDSLTTNESIKQNHIEQSISSDVMKSSPFVSQPPIIRSVDKTDPVEPEINVPVMPSSGLDNGNYVQKQRTIQTPRSLGVGYPSIQLLGHLTQCNESMEMLNPLSSAMVHLATMSGEEMLNYFHKNIVPIGQLNEELHHLLWTSVVPYTEPEREISTCVLLSNQAIYFLSDESPKVYKRRRPAWRTHCRNRSEAVTDIYRTPITFHEEPVDSYHHQSGLLVCASESSSPGRVKSYAMIQLSDIQCVHIGFFDQMFRVYSGGNEEDCRVFSCLTRDAIFTELFLKRLMAVLSSVTMPSPVGEFGPDIFRMYGNGHHDGRWRPEGLEYRHPSKVKFIYPNEDASRDLTFLMHERIGTSEQSGTSVLTRTSSVKSLTREGKCLIIREIIGICDLTTHLRNFHYNTLNTCTCIVTRCWH